MPAGHLDAQDDPDLAQPDIGDQVLDPSRVDVSVPERPQILVNHDHLPGRLASSWARKAKLYWRSRLSGVLPDLGNRRLAHIPVRLPFEMTRRHLREGLNGHVIIRRRTPSTDSVDTITSTGHGSASIIPVA